MSIMFLLTHCEVHTAKYSDRSFDVLTEWNEVHTKNWGPNIFRIERTIG